MPYQPIENYGVIGNLRTVALVGLDGAIDWLCLPHFDSPSLFGALLDDQKGGRFRIAPREESAHRKQFYWPGTNVLVTRFHTADGVAEIVDFMPVGTPEPHQVIRQVKVTRGRVDFRLSCAPAFDYARACQTVSVEGDGARFESAGLCVQLAAPVPLRRDGNGVGAEFTRAEGESATFILRVCEPGAPVAGTCPDHDETAVLFHDTVAYWRKWLSRCTYTGRWREMVERSALALKLLTFEPTGAIIAAPTASLPEAIGGNRNWDYRFTWIRDAAFTIYALLRIGFTDEANAFTAWLHERLTHDHDADENGPLQIVYRVDGTRDLAEVILPHLEGYRGSGPVRIGNAAAGQLQLDIYGELLDAAYLANKHAAPMTIAAWTSTRRTLDWLEQNWRRADEGIWEVRGGRRDFVYSKLMCWVAFDRGLRLAEKRSFPADRARWLATRDQIYETIMRDGWSEKRQAFTQSFGSDTLDATSLLMPLVFFLAPNDPRMLRTLDAINCPPRAGGLVADGLVYRYDLDQLPDGLKGKEGTFSMCTFWLVEALTRAGRTDPRRLEEARLLFERMLGFANHLGLYSEQIGAQGEALGNYPQAFTHLTLISAAFNLDRALGAA